MSKRPLPTNHSGSDEDLQTAMDERKRRRMLSNRESARRSRVRKQQRLDELIGQVTQLKGENAQIVMQVDALAQRYAGVEAENSVLRAEVSGLTERLQSLNETLRFVERVSGMAMDIPEIPEPWQLQYPAQPIADMFRC